MYARSPILHVYLGLILTINFFELSVLPSEILQGSGHGKLLYEEPKSLTGSIYAQRSSPRQLLFRFKRQATRSGSTLEVLREYIYPDGRLAARERVVYEGNALKSYALEELQSGGGGSATVRRDPQNSAKGTVEFEYRKEGARQPGPRCGMNN